MPNLTQGTISSNRLYQGGISIGSDWIELEIGNDFSGTIIFKDNKNGTATLYGFLTAKYAHNYNDDVTICVPPKGYKFNDGNGQLHFINPNATYGYPIIVQTKVTPGLTALHGNVTGSLQAGQIAMPGALLSKDVVINGMTLNITKN